jgi:hypothetical protein
MQTIRTALRSPRLRAVWPRAALAVTMALDQSTRRPPVAAYLVQQLLA